MWGALDLLGQFVLGIGLVVAAVVVLVIVVALVLVLVIWSQVDGRFPWVSARQAKQQKATEPREHWPPLWLRNAEEIFALAEGELRWLADKTSDNWTYPFGHVFVTAWPTRIHWSWSRTREPQPRPDTPAKLADALREFPPLYPDESLGYLADPEVDVVEKHGQPPVIPTGPILPVGTRIRLGGIVADREWGVWAHAEVASGEWAGTRVTLWLERCSEAALIAALGVMPEDEPIASDAVRAAALLERMREVERRSRPTNEPPGSDGPIAQPEAGNG